jgi:HSP20 family protein
MNEPRLNELFDLDPAEFMFRNMLSPWRSRAPASAPQIRVDLSEDDRQYLVKADIPGVRKEDIEVRVDGDQVTISAEVKKHNEEKKDGRVLRSERQYGFATRSFSLACGVDEGKAEARYENGVLELKLPKKAQASSKRLPIA